jgi:hypothetical protein
MRGPRRATARPFILRGSLRSHLQRQRRSLCAGMTAEMTALARPATAAPGGVLSPIRQLLAEGDLSTARLVAPAPTANGRSSKEGALGRPFTLRTGLRIVRLRDGPELRKRPAATALVVVARHASLKADDRKCWGDRWFDHIPQWLTAARNFSSMTAFGSIRAFLSTSPMSFINSIASATASGLVCPVTDTAGKTRARMLSESPCF